MNLFRNIYMLVAYVLGGAILGLIVGHIIVGFIGEETFIRVLSIVMGMLLGAVVASKLKKASNVAILIGILCGAILGFLVRDFFEELLRNIALATNLRVYVNPNNVASFGRVYGAIFGVLGGFVVFVLMSLNVVIDLEEETSKSQGKMNEKSDEDETESRTTRGEKKILEHVPNSPKTAQQTKIAPKQNKEVEIKPNPLDLLLKTPSGIALALGAKVAGKCNKSLDDDTILLLSHMFGESNINGDLNALYAELLREEKDKMGNIKFLCAQLARANLAQEDKIAFIKTLLILCFGFSESVDGIVFSIAVNIGLDSEVYFGIKQEIEASLLEAYSGAQDMTISGELNSEHDMKKLYEILEVTPNHSNDEIKRSYRALVAKYHPDKYASKELPEDMVKYAEERFKDIKRAYDILKKERNIV